MSVTSAQIRMARAALDWTVRDLAKAAGLHRNTITNIERGRGGDPTTLAVIKAILTKAGVQFTEENGDSPGVRLLNRAQNTHIKTVSHDTRADKANRERATLTGAQLRAARALVRVSAAQLAQRAMLGIATVRRAEAFDGPVQATAANCDAIRRALEAAGVEFIDENGGGPGVRLRKPQRGKGHK